MRRCFLYLFVGFCLLAAGAAGQGTSVLSTPVRETANVATPTAQPVWVNSQSKVYHYPGTRWYGSTQHGKYLTEAEAIAEGDRPSQHERKPYPVDAAPSGQSTDASAIPSASLPPGVANQSKDQVSICITAIAAQCDPAKLATLGSRQANPRLKRIMYYLALGRATGADPGDMIDRAQKQNGSFGTPRAPLVKVSLLRNLKICDGLGLLTEGNMSGLRRGEAPTVTRGPYTGQKAEVDHIVPLALASELGNELANLEMLPTTLNRAKSDKVGERQLAVAKAFREAALISDQTLSRIQARFRPAGTKMYEMQE